MSSIRFTSFGAASVPLSKIIPDKDFDIRPYGITAAFAKFPYRPIEWATEELEWGDVPASDPISIPNTTLNLIETWITLKTFNTPPGDGYKWRFIILTSTSSSTANFRVTADGVEVRNVSGHGTGTLTFDAFIPAGSTVAVEGYNNRNYAYYVLDGSTVQNLGIAGGQKTFDLTGKWLALGLDMQGLAATVKIQGVEMPYSDYAKYFPLAPTEITIPGEWDYTQERPVIEVYK
jgi:hypothetical protein